MDVLLSLQNYSECSCIPGPGLARPGTCGTGCSHLFVPFVVLSCLAGILASTSHTPSFMLILRWGHLGAATEGFQRGCVVQEEGFLQLGVKPAL